MYTNFNLIYILYTKNLQDAAKQSEKERERLIEMQRQFEGKRHEMMDRENSLRVKQSELENSIIRTKQREVCWIESFLTVLFEMTLLSNARDGLPHFLMVQKNSNF